MNKANAHNRTIQATGGGNYTIVDTVANLASITLAGTTAANVIANVQNGDKTISDTTLDSDVTIIDLNGCCQCPQQNNQTTIVVMEQMLLSPMPMPISDTEQSRQQVEEIIRLLIP